MYTSGDFILHRNDTPFANRQKLLFDELLTAERDCNKNRAIDTSAVVALATDMVQRQSVIMPRMPKSPMNKFRGRESIFKRPNRPAPRSAVRQIPDHHKNPHKWMKYSLGDVSNEDMTEQSNTQAALSFLKDLRARRLQEQQNREECNMELDEASSSQTKQTKVPFKQRAIKTSSQIQFRKPETHVETEAAVVIDHEDKPMFRSSKLVMPEYVVGQKQKKTIKRDKQTTDKIARANSLRLDHLDEYDDEGEYES